MKVLSANICKYILLQIDGEYSCYRRDVDSHEWEVLMGESWESVFCNKEIEDVYQNFLIEQKRL